MEKNWLSVLSCGLHPGSQSSSWSESEFLLASLLPSNEAVARVYNKNLQVRWRREWRRECNDDNDEAGEVASRADSEGLTPKTSFCPSSSFFFKTFSYFPFVCSCSSLFFSLSLSLSFGLDLHQKRHSMPVSVFCVICMKPTAKWRQRKNLSWKERRPTQDWRTNAAFISNAIIFSSKKTSAKSSEKTWDGKPEKNAMEANSKEL